MSRIPGLSASYMHAMDKSTIQSLICPWTYMNNQPFDLKKISLPISCPFVKQMTTCLEIPLAWLWCFSTSNSNAEC